jgi:hypothetical protein
MKILKIAPNTRILTTKEFRTFIKNKKVYHHVVHWIEEWKGIPDIIDYFPYSGFTLNNKIKLKRYPYTGYSEKCLASTTTSGKFYKDCESYKVSIRNNKKEPHNREKNLYYVTRIKRLF